MNYPSEQFLILHVQKEVLDDTFGRRAGSTLFEGLVDCADESSFDEKLPSIMDKWKSHEESKEAMTGFCEWLLKNKVDVIRHTMLQYVREEAGMGSPPDPFYTNASECMNSVIKVKVQLIQAE